MVKNRIQIARNFHIGYNEFNTIPYYEYEMILTEINRIIEEENKEQERNQNIDSYKSMARDMYRSSTNKLPKI